MRNPDIDCLFEDDRWTGVLSEDDAGGAAVTALAAAGFSDAASLCIAFVDDTRLRGLNRDYRGKDAPTNVLSFPMAGEQTSGLPRTLGDMALAYETIEREAREAGIPLRNHAIHLIVHGSLHLIGYNHDNAQDAEQMESLEIRALERLGIANPYDPPNRNEKE